MTGMVFPKATDWGSSPEREACLVLGPSAPPLAAVTLEPQVLGVGWVSRMSSWCRDPEPDADSASGGQLGGGARTHPAQAQVHGPSSEPGPCRAGSAAPPVGSRRDLPHTA